MVARVGYLAAYATPPVAVAPLAGGPSVGSLAGEGRSAVLADTAKDVTEPQSIELYRFNQALGESI